MGFKWCETISLIDLGWIYNFIHFIVEFILLKNIFKINKKEMLEFINNVISYGHESND